MSAEAGRLLSQVEKETGDTVCSPLPADDVLRQSVYLILSDPHMYCIHVIYAQISLCEQSCCV